VETDSVEDLVVKMVTRKILDEEEVDLIHNLDAQGKASRNLNAPESARAFLANVEAMKTVLKQRGHLLSAIEHLHSP
jgi:hypothetical protein